MFSTQAWLSETPAQKAANSGTPTYLSVGMSVLALGVVSAPLPLISYT